MEKSLFGRLPRAIRHRIYELAFSSHEIDICSRDRYLPLNREDERKVRKNSGRGDDQKLRNVAKRHLMPTMASSFALLRSCKGIHSEAKRYLGVDLCAGLSAYTFRFHLFSHSRSLTTEFLPPELTINAGIEKASHSAYWEQLVKWWQRYLTEHRARPHTIIIDLGIVLEQELPHAQCYYVSDLKETISRLAEPLGEESTTQIFIGADMPYGAASQPRNNITYFSYRLPYYRDDLERCKAAMNRMLDEAQRQNRTLHHADGPSGFATFTHLQYCRQVFKHALEKHLVGKDIWFTRSQAYSPLHNPRGSS